MPRGKVTIVVDGDNHTKDEWGVTLEKWIGDINNGFVFPHVREDLSESEMFRIIDVAWTWEEDNDSSL